MSVWTTALRVPRQWSAGDTGRAIIWTGVIVPFAAAASLWLFPAGCDLRGSPAIYRWSCLFPWLLACLPTVVAGVLSVAFTLNRRRAVRLPDGWLLAVPAAGVLAQVICVGGYLFLLDSAYRVQFLGMALFIPQPFAAGAVAGAVYWVALHRRRIRRQG